MSTAVTVVARLHPASESVEQAAAVVRAALAGIRAEDGCLQYDPHLADDGSFLIVERWASRDALDAHSTGAPVQVLREGLEGLTTAPAEVTVAEAL
ncbi:putative quinol monooxygenase [Agromyces rhizosphaerae]|nr:putative quinol monooxygenase [Agromyces rhizosphaerae]